MFSLIFYSQVVLTLVVFQDTGTKQFLELDSQMRCKSALLHFPISPQPQVSLLHNEEFSLNKLTVGPTEEFCCRTRFMSLTVHLDLKCDRCISQSTACIESVLALLLYVQSLQLQAGVVSNATKKRNVY